MKNLLGGKGANLAEITNLKIPVPAGFTITTEVCTLYYKNNRKYPKELEGQANAAIAKVEKIMGKKFGDPVNPLLLSVRSGARSSKSGNGLVRSVAGRWNGGMSQSLLYHAFGIPKTYRYGKTEYVGGAIWFTVRPEQKPEDCPHCQGKDFVGHGQRQRKVRMVPTGLKRVELKVEVPRLSV